MQNTTIRIRRNDPTLAHAMASAELRAIAVRTEKWVASIFESNSLGEFVRASSHAFGNSVIAQSQSRTRGSRARMQLVVVDANLDRDFTLGIFSFNARMPQGERVSSEIPRLVVRHHAVARAMQRTTGQSKIREVIRLLSPHLLAGYRWLKTTSPPKNSVEEIQFIGKGGALIGNVHQLDGKAGLEFATWVDGENASDPCIRAAAFSVAITIRTK